MSEIVKPLTLQASESNRMESKQFVTVVRVNYGRKGFQPIDSELLWRNHLQKNNGRIVGKARGCSVWMLWEISSVNL